ncbi:DUF177 domain-containing protein [Paroceanicella profunda]|uniref:DUF177 domain-containing protein n=1 Tax=Paroceanicella profunda TaxID=2579971 RepID=A0A5B8G0R0_9RHOB|nr:DUF177 domain-containing protein [Paroceanicella profunda]QDL93370.1 DUF177 domain-containing protein [Paroceanicella profunda]
MPKHARRPDLPPETPEMSRPVRLDRLGASEPRTYTEVATDAERRALARLFDAHSVDKFRFTVTLTPLGTSGWALDGLLEASIIQSCVLTLAPVPAKLSEPIRRRFLPEGTPVDPQIEDEVEPLESVIDLGGVAIETAALALDPYPRAPGAGLETSAVAPPEAEAGDEARPNPFARLAELKQKLGDGS